MRKLLLLAAFTVLGAWGQPVGEPAARLRFGASLPSSCSPTTGEVFVLINVSAVTGVAYNCSSLNTWSAMTGGTTSAAWATLTSGTSTSLAAVMGSGASLGTTGTGTITATTAAKWFTARNLGGNSVDGSANVAFANKFIVQGTTDAGLSGSQFLGALGTGILKNTTSTGILGIAVAGDFPTLNQNTTGTAAALGATPGQCGANNFSTGIAASGNANCSQPAVSNLSDGIAVVKNNQTNTYTAGARQVFQSSATTAMWNFPALTGDPSALSQGDFWYRSDLFLLGYYQGSGVKSILPYELDASLPVAGNCLKAGTATGSIMDAGSACGGSGTVTVVSAGSLASNAIMTGGGAQASQTPNSATTVDSGGNISTPGSMSSGVGSGKTGYVEPEGATSGGQGFTVPDIAGTPTLYVLPTAPGSGKFLQDTGSTTCPTLPSGAPSNCEQLAWSPAAFINVSTLPTAATAVVGSVYQWSGSAGTNTCPAAGAGGSGGSATSFCITFDGANWDALATVDITGAMEVVAGAAHGWHGRTQLLSVTDGEFALCNNAVSNCLELAVGSATVASGFGTSPSIAGNGSAGRVTIGSSPGNTGVVSFSTPYLNTPSCSAQNESRFGVNVQAVPLTTGGATTLTLNSWSSTTGTATNFTATDTITYLCMNSH